jgi:hypothetical protein
VDDDVELRHRRRLFRWRGDHADVAPARMVHQVRTRAVYPVGTEAYLRATFDVTTPVLPPHRATGFRRLMLAKPAPRARCVSAGTAS